MVLPWRERNSGAGSSSGCTEGPTLVAWKGFQWQPTRRGIPGSSGFAAYTCVRP